MSGENTTTTLNGLLKRVYSDKVEKVIPDNNLITQTVPFVPSSMKLGESLYVPVQLTKEQGITYAGPGAGAFAYATAVPGSVKQASVNGYQILGHSQLDFETAAKARNANSLQAFERAMDNVVDSNLMSLRHRQEVNFLYGGSTLATVSGVSGQVLTISAATWAAYHWVGMQGAAVDVYDASDVYKFTATITAVDSANKKITIGSGTAVATDTLRYSGTKGNEALGIYKILTTSGTLFGIDNSVNDLWAGNVVDCAGGALTRDKLDEAVTYAMDKGFIGDTTLFINPRIFSDLVQEQAALHRFNDGNVDLKTGARAITQFTQAGTMTIKPHTAVRLGDGFLLDTASWVRVGAVDCKLGDPVDEDAIIVRLPNNAGYQMISYSLQAMFTKRPANNIVLKNIGLAS